MNISVIMILFIGLWSLQILFSVRQVREYQRVLREVTRLSHGHLGAGTCRPRFSPGRGVIVVAAVDESGILLDFHMMRGYTVFASFHQHKEFMGQSARETYENLKSKREKKAFQKALLLINTEREKGNLLPIVWTVASPVPA